MAGTRFIRLGRRGWTYAFRGDMGDGDVFEVGFSDVDGEDGGGAGWGEVGEFFAAYGAEPAAVGDGGEAAVGVA